MFRAIILSFFGLFVMATLQAQEGCRIKVVLDGYTYDTLWFGHTFGKREVPEFFGLRQPGGSYELRSEAPLPSGMYAIIYRKNPTLYESFQCWLADGQRNFIVDTKLREPYQATVKGSPENEALYRYNKVFKSLDDHLDDAIDRWRYLPNEENFHARVAAEKALHDIQQTFIEQNPGTLTAELIRQTMLPLPPEPDAESSNWEAEAERRWHWQKTHYFDNMDLGKEGFTRYLQWMEATDFYLLHLPPPSPDTTIALIDDVLQKLEANPDAWQYYNKYLTTSLARMSQYRLDEVFVHMVRTYLDTGKATWADADDLRKMTADAERMEPLFEGKKAPNITLYDQAENPVNLYDVQAPCTILVFYMPDCSHCKRELPRIKESYARYKAKGLKVVSVCGKFGADAAQCWDFAETFQLPKDWYLVCDPERRSNMATLFNLRSFPRIYFLDKDKNIVFKRAGEMEDWQLDAVLEGVAW